MERTPEDGITMINDGVQHGSMKNTTDNRDTAQMSYLSKLAAIDIEFNDLTYTLPGPARGNRLNSTIDVSY